MSKANLASWLKQADRHDWQAGLEAYQNYNTLMNRFAEFYGFSVACTTAAFVALSPNNEYTKNIRSLVSVLAGVSAGVATDEIVVSTYNHCRDRAVTYLQGEVFDTPGRGLKTRSFYRNILDPDSREWVTVDGHMVAAYVNKQLKMSEARVAGKGYREIRDSIQALAEEQGLIPCQLQAILWFTRKRVLDIAYKPQMQLFAEPGDVWGVMFKPEDVKPYAKKV